jgi:putative SOS response-associated peptidase YedK
MCGRYVLVQKVEMLERRFNVKAPVGFEYQPSYNIVPGSYAPVITNENPRQLDLLRFGLTPFWSKKSLLLINARAEGDHNQDDNPEYAGAKGIITKPSFRKPIRSQRCLVLADCFIEGTTVEKLSKPYVVYLKEEERPFAFAGIWDIWANPETGEVIRSFSIITTVANELLRKIPHHRSPVILPRSLEQAWIRNDLPLSDVTGMLRPYPSDLMNAYPIDPAIKNPRANGPHLLKPIGQRLMPEYDTRKSTDVKLQGMGMNKRLKEAQDFLEFEV